MADRTSAMTGGSNSFQTTSEDLNKVRTNYIANGPVGAITNTSGVAPMTGVWAVNAQGSPNMTVAVTGGDGIVTATPTSQSSQKFNVTLTTQNATSASNASGGTRFDWIYVTLSASALANPSSDGTSPSSVTVSRSTSSTTDNGTPPTYGTNIAIVTVANSASSITNGNIADKRVRSGFVGGLVDANNNELIKESATASAVNEITVANAATGGTPSITASGDDTNISLNLVSKGSGTVQINGNAINAGTWTTWTPTWSGGVTAIGNAVVYAKYQQIGKTVHGEIGLQVGSSTTFGASTITFTLPVTGATLPTFASPMMGQVYIEDSGVQGYQGFLQQASTTTGIVLAIGTATTYAGNFGANNTVPFTWGTGDFFAGYFVYQAA